MKKNRVLKDVSNVLKKKPIPMKPVDLGPLAKARVFGKEKSSSAQHNMVYHSEVGGVSARFSYPSAETGWLSPGSVEVGHPTCLLKI